MAKKLAKGGVKKPPAGAKGKRSAMEAPAPKISKAVKKAIKKKTKVAGKKKVAKGGSKKGKK